MNKFIFAIACALLMSAGACKKGEGLNGGGGTYTLKGKILKDCSGTPYAGARLRVSFSSNSLANSEYDFSAGEGTTAADGSFEILCENHGAGQISLHSDAGNSGVNWVNDYEIPNSTGVVELGTLYETYLSTILLKFTSTALSATDTLYFGEFKTRAWDTVVGFTGSFVFFSTGDYHGDRPPYPQQRPVLWGIGLVDYCRAIDSFYANPTSNPGYHKVNIKLNFCEVRDTTYVPIP